MADHGTGHDSKAEAKREERTWKETRTQARVRPQWNPLELAHELLDEMAKKKAAR